MAKNTTTYLAIVAIPVAAFAAFVLYDMTKPPAGPAPDMSGAVFDANKQTCNCGGE